MTMRTAVALVLFLGACASDVGGGPSFGVLGLDDDNDGEADEEVCGDNVDDDNDGIVDEDCRCNAGDCDPADANDPGNGGDDPADPNDRGNGDDPADPNDPGNGDDPADPNDPGNGDDPADPNDPGDNDGNDPDDPGNGDGNDPDDPGNGDDPANGLRCASDADCPAGGACVNGACAGGDDGGGDNGGGDANGEVCGNGLDDDGDGLVDENCNDPAR